jgi:DNA topoisomerase-1
MRISPVAEAAAADYIMKNWGPDALPTRPRHYKSNSNSQDAHEAIRPSNVNIHPQKLRKTITSDQYKLYKLIWERFIASQMQAAVLDTLSIDIENSGYIFKAGGYIVKSQGYMAVYDNREEESEDGASNLASLPSVKKRQTLSVSTLEKAQHFTEPPARFTEASLVKFLEENGIGRPSTYATIISTIISREYVKRDGKSLAATDLGTVTTEFMRENFSDIVDYEFTAYMESQLDSIESGKNTAKDVLSTFYKKFKDDLDAVMKNDKTYTLTPEVEESDVVCELCGSKMVYKNGRFGRFLACPRYPACRNTKAVDKNGNVVTPTAPKVEYADFACERCGGRMVVKRGRFGVFYACENYPKCTFTKQKSIEVGAPCPKCSSKVLARHGKTGSLFYSCERYPECDFSSWDMPLLEKCPECGEALYYKKNKKSVICKKKGCGYKREEEIAVVE